MSPADVFAGFQEAGQTFFAVSGWVVGLAVFVVAGIVLTGWSACAMAGIVDDAEAAVRAEARVELGRMRAERVQQGGAIPADDLTDTFTGMAAWPGREGR